MVEKYGIDREKVVRPFWPGGDYEAYDYPEGSVVVDNPPFSILTKIVRWYTERGIRYFLFAPYLTNFSTAFDIDSCCHIVISVGIIYENGANVATCFLTNLEKTYHVMTCPDLHAQLKAANAENLKDKVVTHPKYTYPDNVLTATDLGRLSKYGQELSIKSEDLHYIGKLDSQKPFGKGLYGGGFLLSEKAAAEKAAAEKAAAEKAAAIVWELSDREKEIIESLGKEKTA